MKRKFPLAVAVLILFSASGQVSPELDRPRRLATGVVELDLRGTAGASYAIEGSTNLLSWFSVFSGVAANGVFSVRHDGASNYPTLFYRGRTAAETLPAVTLGLEANTNTAVVSSMSMSGGSATLYGRSGTRYTLTLGTNSIPDAVVFTMAEVTNFTGLPFAGPVIGAVRIEPGNLAVWGAATLEITFPTNVDRRKIASFASRTDGSAFQLTLDRVGTNRVLIPVARGGVYGSSVVTAAELADAARREIGAPTASLTGAKKTASAMVNCLSGGDAAAQALDTLIRGKKAIRGQAASARLAAARQNQLSGAPDDDPNMLAEVAADICNFYQTEVAPLWPQAKQICATGKVMTQHALSLAREIALLGGDEDCIPLSSMPFCEMFAVCLQEIENCCDAGEKDTGKLTAVLSLQRQDALLGTDCITQERAQEVMDACSSNIWRGTFSLTVNGHTNITRTSASSQTIQINSYNSSFQGSAFESTESGTAESGFIVELQTRGQIDITQFDSQSSELFGCGGSLFRESEETVAAAETDYTITLLTFPGGGYTLLAGNRTPQGIPAVPARVMDIQLRITRSCDPEIPEIVINNTTRSPTLMLGYPSPLHQGTYTDAEVIEGSVTQEYEENGLPMRVSAQWSLKRRKAGE